MHHIFSTKLHVKGGFIKLNRTKLHVSKFVRMGTKLHVENYYSFFLSKFNEYDFGGIGGGEFLRINPLFGISSINAL